MHAFNTFHCKQTTIHMTHKHKCSPQAPQYLVNAMANKWRLQHSRQTKWLAVWLAVYSVFVCSVPALHSSTKCLIDKADFFPSRKERRPSGSHLHGSACIFLICYLICSFRWTERLQNVKTNFTTPGIAPPQAEGIRVIWHLCAMSLHLISCSGHLKLRTGLLASDGELRHSCLVWQEPRHLSFRPGVTVMSLPNLNWSRRVFWSQSQTISPIATFLSVVCHLVLTKRFRTASWHHAIQNSSTWVWISCSRL